MVFTDRLLDPYDPQNAPETHDDSILSDFSEDPTQSAFRPVGSRGFYLMVHADHLTHGSGGDFGNIIKNVWPDFRVPIRSPFILPPEEEYAGILPWAHHVDTVGLTDEQVDHFLAGAQYRMVIRQLGRTMARSLMRSNAPRLLICDEHMKVVYTRSPGDPIDIHPRAKEIMDAYLAHFSWGKVPVDAEVEYIRKD